MSLLFVIRACELGIYYHCLIKQCFLTFLLKQKHRSQTQMHQMFAYNS